MIPTGTIVANAAIVPAGTGGAISVYPNDATNLVSDIDGYFAPAGTGGLSFYPVAPCRVIDTRKGNGAFNGALNPPVDVAEQRLRAAQFVASLCLQRNRCARWPAGVPDLVARRTAAPHGLNLERRRRVHHFQHGAGAHQQRQSGCL